MKIIFLIFFHSLALTHEGITNLTLKTPFEYYLSNYCGSDMDHLSCTIQEKQNIVETYLNNFPSSLTLENYKNQNFGLYSSKIGNGILFIFTDSKTFVNEETGTIFGQQQLQYIENTVENAYRNPNVHAVIITYNHPWIYNEQTYSRDWVKQDYITIDKIFDAEKQKLANILSRFNYLNPDSSDYTPVIMVIGERMMAFDQGLNNKFGNFPVLTCGSTSIHGSCKGGPYSHGFSNGFDNQYCLITGYYRTPNKMCLELKGFIANKSPPKQEALFFTYDTCEPKKYARDGKFKCSISWKEKIIHSFIIIGVNVIIVLIFMVGLYKIANKTMSFQVTTNEAYQKIHTD